MCALRADVNGGSFLNGLYARNDRGANLKINTLQMIHKKKSVKCTSEEILKNWSTKEFPENVFWISECKETKAHIIIVIVSPTTARTSIKEAVFAIVVVGSSLFVCKKKMIINHKTKEQQNFCFKQFRSSTAVLEKKRDPTWRKVLKVNFFFLIGATNPPSAGAI